MKRSRTRTWEVRDRIIALTVGLAALALIAAGTLFVAHFLAIERTHRSAREGRNPATGETIQIPAGYGVKVSAGCKLKAAAK